MDALFNPRSIAVIGASKTPGKIGHAILTNIIKYGFRGRVYPVNPKYDEIEDLKCYPTVLDIPDEIDLAVIVIPAEQVPKAVGEAGAKGAKVAVVISSGFKEAGRADLEESLLEYARKYNIRVLGPNIFGICYTPRKLNATFGPQDVIPGSIALVSQSGALGIALMGWTIVEKVGLSALISLGNKADIDDADLLEWLRDDPNTSVIMIYLEGVKDGRRFMEEAKKTSAKKPVIVIKAGKTKRGMQAVASHTGSLAGMDSVYNAAFEQSGVLRAGNLEEAFDWARLFSTRKTSKGENTIIITNGGGVGVLATDACEELGVKLLDPPEDLKREFMTYMPPFGSPRNPVDITGQATHVEFEGAIDVAIRKDIIDNIIVLYCQTAVADPIKLAEVLIKANKSTDKPIVAAMIGGEKVSEAMDMLKREGFPVYPTPERAVSSMAAMIKWSLRRKILEEKTG